MIYIQTFGCKVNQYESEKIAEKLAEAGLFQVNIDFAEVVIVNSCMVTENAEKKVKTFIRRQKEKGKFVILTGCIANKNIQTIADVSISDKEKLVEFVKEKIQPSEVETVIFPHKTRKFIKIQDGCDRFCSYCIIPYARNLLYSKPISDILQEVETAAAENYKEIVLIGINIGRHTEGLVNVIEKCAEISGIERIRLGSLEADLLTFEDLERLAKISKFCPHFHLSLQSGCDKILKAMNRRYTTEEYHNLVKKIRSLWENVSITTDIIVGFPGETETDFEETCRFAEKIGFLKIHVFPYSRRSGTVADTMPEQVPESTKAKYVKTLLEISKRSEEQYYISKKGKNLPVLFEQSNETEHKGHTPDFLLVTIPNIDNSNLQNQVINVKI